MLELKCGTKIKWCESESPSIKEGIIVYVGIDSYKVAELDTGLIYDVMDKNIISVMVNGEWVGCYTYADPFIKLSSRFPKSSGRYPWGNASAVKFEGKYYKTNGLPIPKKVIFNGPATVVLWVDNTKTVVKKSEDEPDDREKALMYCVFKKFLDDKKRDMDRYLRLFYKVLEEDKKDEKKD